MQTIYVYRTIPGFFMTLRSRIAKVGAKKLTHYQDDRYNRIGFLDGQDAYCVDAASIVGYYQSGYPGELPPQKAVQMYIRDVSEILHENDKKPN